MKDYDAFLTLIESRPDLLVDVIEAGEGFSGDTIERIIKIVSAFLKVYHGWNQQDEAFQPYSTPPTPPR